LIHAVEIRFGKLEMDLAASPENAKAPRFITKEIDSLKIPWPTDCICWLNPEFADIEPWAKKCAEHAGKVLMLTPASVGSRWFARYVHGQALVLALSPRLIFEGTNAPYPKDCIISAYGFGDIGFDVWQWNQVEQPALAF
jgi:hypothetical protein